MDHDITDLKAIKKKTHPFKKNMWLLPAIYTDNIFKVMTYITTESRPNRRSK